jgi:hypothetical protein
MTWTFKPYLCIASADRCEDADRRAILGGNRDGILKAGMRRHITNELRLRRYRGSGETGTFACGPREAGPGIIGWSSPERNVRTAGSQL